jgi:hypothetical protein
MDYKKIQARNKFVGKISEKIDKLTQDIELLLQVDQALNSQVGGGLLDKIIAATSAAAPGTINAPKINNTALNAKAIELTNDLQKKITTLEETLGILLSHISKGEPYDLSKLDVTMPTDELNQIAAEINKLDTQLDADKFEQFNSIYKRFTVGDTIIAPADYKQAFSRADKLAPQVKDLLHKSIISSRSEAKFKTKSPATYL